MEERDKAKYTEYLLKNHRIIKTEIEIMETELQQLSQQQDIAPAMRRKSYVATLVDSTQSDMTADDMQEMIDTARKELVKLEKAIEALDDNVKGVIMDLYIYRLTWSQASRKRYVSPNTLSRRRTIGIRQIAELMQCSMLRSIAEKAAASAKEA